MRKSGIKFDQLAQTAYRIVEHGNQQIRQDDVGDEQIDSNQKRHQPSEVCSARCERPRANAASLLFVFIQECLTESLVVGSTSYAKGRW